MHRSLQNLGLPLRVVLTVSALLFALAPIKQSSAQTPNVLPKPSLAPFGNLTPDGREATSTINVAFSPDGSTVYFSKSHLRWQGLTIFQSHKTPTGWSPAEVAPFSGIYRDTDPAVTPDGKTLIFATVRNQQTDAIPIYSLYRVNLKDPAGQAVPLSSKINDGASILYPSIALDGSLYFIRSAPKTMPHIFRSRLVDGQYQAPERITIPGDSDTIFDSDPTISPNQDFLVFASNRSDSLGSNDLYIAFQRGNEWCSPIHLEAPINSPDPELATGLSLDGKTLYFASARSANIPPRPKAIDTAGFLKENAATENGLLRTYQVDISQWLEANRPSGTTCTKE